MMTRKEIIKDLEYLVSGKCTDTSYSNHADAIRAAIDLLKNEKVWIVSWYDTSWMDDEPAEPTVTPFNNEKAAKKYFEYEQGRSHTALCIDDCDVFTTFKIKGSCIDFK